MFFFDHGAKDAPDTFEARLDKAYTTSSLTPDKTHGRNVWVSKRLGERGITASPESVRKWFAGLTRPRGSTLETLADILGVSADWLDDGKIDGKAAAEAAADAQYDVEFPWDDDEIFDVDFESIEKSWLGAESSQEERENAIAAGFISARLFWAGIDHRHRGSRILMEQGTKAREIAVVPLHPVADRGGHYVARLPQARSGFEPYTTSFDVLVFVMPRGGRDPRLFAILGKAAARLGEPGEKITITESNADGMTKINLTTIAGKSVSVSPIGDLSALQKIMA